MKKPLGIPSPLHRRNRHTGRYDFAVLTAASPELATYAAVNAYGDTSIDFANPAAVKALNRALLKSQYAITDWDVPAGYLCPPIPGRADTIHHIADLLAESTGGIVPRGAAVRVLDVGTGASAVYPIIGHGEYGWSFVATDIDPVSLDNVARIARANPAFSSALELRIQKSPTAIFAGVVKPGERFDLTVCNPPFHTSAEEAREGSARKWRNLGKTAPGHGAPVLNFGGQAAELWCPGGEVAFIRRMIDESRALGARVRWFTTLLSKWEHLEFIDTALRQAGVAEARVIDMAQGVKKSRLVAWRF